VLRLLDSTVLIDYLRGRPALGCVRGLRAAGDVPCTTAINVEEVVRGRRARMPTLRGNCSRASTSCPSVPGRAGRQAVGVGKFPARGVTLWQADCSCDRRSATGGRDPDHG